MWYAWALWTQVNATTVALTLTDGGVFDLDGSATNGVTVDPVGVGAGTAAPSGGGGCSINTTVGFDPTILVMMLLSLLYLLRRGQRNFV